MNNSPERPSDAFLREAYRQALHGAGAASRNVARGIIEAHVAKEGLALAELFAERGWDLTAYFASRPIVDGRTSAAWQST